MTGGSAIPEEGVARRDVIIDTISRLIFPFILLFGFYVTIGTEGTGGGFQGGTILAAGFILYITVFGAKRGREKIPESVNTFFESFGLYLYNGSGLLCIIFSMGAVQFLNYPGIWPVTDLVGVAGSRAWIIAFMVEVGIGLTVMAAFISQYFDLAWKDEEEMVVRKE